MKKARGRGKIYLCAFCRVPTPSSEEEDTNRTNKLISVDNANGYYQLAGYYATGSGVSQDITKANELYLRAGELGHTGAYCKLGVCYYYGEGVDVDKKKAIHFYELASMNGDVYARHNLGCVEAEAGNIARATKHFILAARAGHKESLDMVKTGFMKGVITKDEYANTLRAYQKAHDEMKSDMRDKARDRLL